MYNFIALYGLHVVLTTGLYDATVMYQLSMTVSASSLCNPIG